jgi:hypothetical protein
LVDLLALALLRAMGHAGPVNTAPQDFPHDFGVLQQKRWHATDHELELAHLLEEFNW